MMSVWWHVRGRGRCHPTDSSSSPGLDNCLTSQRLLTGRGGAQQWCWYYCCNMSAQYIHSAFCQNRGCCFILFKLSKDGIFAFLYFTPLVPGEGFIELRVLCKACYCQALVPNPKPSSPQSHQAQSQPSSTQFETQINPKGTGADTKIL